MISVTNARLILGGNEIFNNLSWRIDSNQRIGLVGSNGSGKTSLLRVLTGEYPLDEGSVDTTKKLRVGYLPQDSAESPQGTVRDWMWEAFDQLNELEEQMHILLHQIESEDDTSPNHARALEKYGVFQEEFTRRGGYQRESDAKKVMLGLGFQHEDWDRPVAEFSGGWRMRVLLAKLLLQRPDIYLLDEPTNHLDPDSLAWLEDYLMTSQSGMVVVSHDRYFLDRVVNGVAEIDRKKFKTYTGNYSTYKNKKAAEKEQLLATRRNQDKQIAHLQSFVDRFRAKNTKATQAQSRIKQIEKIDLVEIEEEASTIRIPMPETPRSGKDVLTIENITHRYGDLTAVQDINANIYRGDRIAVWGANGAGKSTLLSIMAKMREPSEGTVTWGYNTHIAYFSQQHAELQTSNNSILDELSGAAPPEMQTRLRDVLGAFLFKGDDVFKPVKVLSGGEKSRVAMAKLLIHPCNVMMMDEPLNHLDIATVEMLERTLQAYTGTLIFVSHDRLFAERLAEQVWELDAGHMKIFAGTFKEYWDAKNAERFAASKQSAVVENKSEENSQSKEDRKAQKRKDAEERKARNAVHREIKKRYQSLEEQIAEIEEEMKKLEAQMISEEVLKDAAKITEATKRYKAIQSQKEVLYVEWEDVVEELESIA
jgi:ATP-binding cassette subfamily F protein 3